LTLEEGIPRLREPLEGVNFSSDENIRRPGKLYAKDGRGIARVQVTSGNCSRCSRRNARARIEKGLFSNPKVAPDRVWVIGSRSNHWGRGASLGTHCRYLPPFAGADFAR
jgi:hypothetical protein